MAIKQISVFVENRPGRLSVITKCLADAGISIRALCVADTTDFGILRLIVSDTEGAEVALKSAGVTVSVTDVIAVAIPDVPGSFAKAVSVLADASVSVEYAYAFLTPEAGRAIVILRVDDNEVACKVLVEAGVGVVDQKELLG